MGLGLIHIMTFYFLFSSSSFLSLSNDSYPDEPSTMLKLRASLSPAPPPSWTASDAYCNWSGVVCDTSSLVTSIDLSSKSFVGTLPDLDYLSRLRILSLQNNTFIGSIPLLPDVEEIHLDSNSFSSPSDAFMYLSSLRILTINNNPLLQWEFPFSHGCPNLTVFEAINSGMTGSFPPDLSLFPSLRVLRLSGNNLTGNISQWPFPDNYNSKLQTLWLDQQTELSGPLDFLASFTQLAQVRVNGNWFSGSIPDLSNCTKLVDLQLNDNQLQGFVPRSLSALPNLLNVSLQNNSLFGPYPNFSAGVKVEIGDTSNFCSAKPGVACNEQVIILLDVITEMGYPGNLMDAWKGSNACKWQFIGCDDNGNVTTVNLAGQQFDGDIPYSLGNLTTLLELHLNDNAFSGDIPESLTLLPRLKVFDVSNNYLTGTIPKFRSSVRVNVDGNSLVANESVFQAASASSEDSGNPSPGSNFSSSTHSGSILGMKVKTFILVCVALATLVVLTASTVIYLLSKRYKKRRRHENEWEGDSEGQLWDGNRSHKQAVELRGLLRRFSYENLKLITGNFDPTRKLGGGGFGSVYEGNLIDGTKVAVKRLDRIGQGRKEFVAEVMTLGRIHHFNLVKLIGFCDESAYRLLVYEHMSNGSLDKWIFQKQEFSTLCWDTRKNIILQIAKGLAYLHEECQHRIAHLDIKPQNILLDENFNAKVADFGLAKLIDREESFVMTQMRGTRGYLAPEWLSRKITEKADVYSFGIVLLEVVFGRRNLEYYKNHEHDEEEEEEEEEEERANGLLVHLVKKRAEANRLSELVEGCYQDMDGNGEEVEKIVKFAIFCLHENPTRRPTMSTVVKALEGQMNMVLVELESTCSSDCATSSDSFLNGSSGSSSVSASVLSGPR